MTNFISVVCFACSLLLDMPYRYILWFGSIGVEFIVDMIHYKQIPFNGHHLPERFGLFTIVVLGEAVLEIVDSWSSVSNYNSANDWGLTALAIIGVFCLWWIYFFDFTGEVAQETSLTQITWAYMHLPLHAAHALLGTLLRIILSYSDSGLVPTDVAFLYLTTLGFAFVTNSILKILFSYAEMKDEDESHDFVYVGAAAISRFGMAIIAFFCMLIPSDHMTPYNLIGLFLAISASQVVIDVIITIYESRYLKNFTETHQNYEVEEGHLLHRRKTSKPSSKKSTHSEYD